MDKYSVLKDYFGHDSFRNGQEEIIDSILSGRDVLGIMPTGAGKSLCYQVPALLLKGITIVVSPLISLMKDQVSSLSEYGISAAYINSSLSPSQYREVFSNARKGHFKIIYVAPERLGTEEFLYFAENTEISLVTVDEAHCVSQWGQDFRPSYLKIVEFIRRLSYRPVVGAFTATATAEVRDDIIRILCLENPFTITTGFDRKNLYFGVIKAQNKYAQLKELLASKKDKCGIVYCLSRKNVEEVCEKLCEDGFSATRYHAGLSDSERRENQDDFIYDRKLVMVATNAFGMGIDKSNVSFVFHYNMPKNIENYYQEAGRAGRDGGQADCVILYSGADVRTNKFMIENSREDNTELSPEQAEEIMNKDLERLKYMTYYCTSSSCLREFILRYFGESSSSDCGNCSSCLGSFDIADISIEAQKIVSCVYRIFQKGHRGYGKSMVIDVLRGSKNERLISLGFDSLSTYGIMKECKPEKLRRILDFLIENNYLIQTDEEYPTIRLSQASADILKNKIKLEMKLPSEKKPESRRKSEDAYYAESPLFRKLRELRSEFAAKENVPAYIVFSDAALKDMCRKLPVNTQQFLDISGVGRQKCEKYGKAFCSLIARHTAENPDEAKAPEGQVSYLERELASFREQVVTQKNCGIYKAWSAEEDRQLRSEISQSMTIEEIAKAHSRSVGAISSRIKKLSEL